MTSSPDAARRYEGLQRVRAWFAPVFAPDEPLHAALAATPFRLNAISSLVGTAKELTGNNQGRILLLTDRAIHVAGRQFWKRRFRKVIVSYRLHSVPVTFDGEALHIAGQPYFLNWAGFQLGGAVGTMHDVQLFLGAG